MEQGIPIPLLQLIVPLLRLRHVIHLICGGSNLQPLTPKELSFIDEIMSGKFSYPSVKEARRLRKSEKKRKRALVDTFFIDNCVAVKLVVAPGSVEPSPARSSKKTKPDEPPDIMSVHLPLDEYVCSDPSFIKVVADDLLLPADYRRFTDISLVQTIEWGLAHLY